MLLRVVKLFNINHLECMLKVKHEECHAQENQSKGHVDGSFTHSSLGRPFSGQEGDIGIAT